MGNNIVQPNNLHKRAADDVALLLRVSAEPHYYTIAKETRNDICRALAERPHVDAGDDEGVFYTRTVFTTNGQIFSS